MRVGQFLIHRFLLGLLSLLEIEFTVRLAVTRLNVLRFGWSSLARLP